MEQVTGIYTCMCKICIHKYAYYEVNLHMHVHYPLSPIFLVTSRKSKYTMNQLTILFVIIKHDIKQQ